MSTAGHQLAILAGSAAFTAAATAWWRNRGVPGGHQRWSRTNHAGQNVSLLEGPSLVLGTSAALACSDPTSAVLCLAGGSVGAWDDLHPDAARKGLAGHLGALTRGEVSPGALKILGLGSSAVIAVWVDQRGDENAGWADLVLGSVLVAGAANLINLFDLRPGRALKVAALSSLALWHRRDSAVAAVLGASLASLPLDLAGQSMMGDTGANPIGALLGLGAMRSLSRTERLVATSAVVGLTLLSERVSFSAVIANTPVLRELDQWGRA